MTSISRIIAGVLLVGTLGGPAFASTAPHRPRPTDYIALALERGTPGVAQRDVPAGPALDDTRDTLTGGPAGGLPDRN